MSVVLVAVAFVAAFAQQQPVRKIVPKDVLKLTCVEEELLNKEYKVTKDGVILMDFLGAVEVSGLTDDEAAALVSKKLTEERIVRTATVKIEFKGAPRTAEATPGNAGSTPVNAGAVPGNTGSTPGNAGSTPGNSGAVPGTAGSTPGNAGSTPGNAGSTPGNAGATPGNMEKIPEKAVPFVTCTGEFKVTGDKPFKEGMTVADLITEIGANDSADVTKVVVKSPDGSTRFVDATKSGTGGPLKAGDEVILVSTSGPAKEVYVLGSVSRPGSVKHKAGMTAKSAIEAAGGFAGAGEKKRVSIERNGQIVQTLDETKPGADLAIQPDDRVLVETGEARAYVRVEGAVRSPGYFVAKPGMRLSEAVAAAGGFGPKAKTKKVQVTSVGGKPRTIDYDEIEQGYMGDVLLQPGDQVVVPGQKRKDDTLLKLGGGLAAFWLLFGR